MRQKRSSRCRALARPAGRVRVEGPRNPWDGWHGLRAEAGAPRSPSVRTLLRLPAARGVETPAARGGSAARSFCCDPSSRPRPPGPPEDCLPLLSGWPSPPSPVVRPEPPRESVAPAPACPTGLGESFPAPGKSSLRKRAPSARPA